MVHIAIIHTFGRTYLVPNSRRLGMDSWNFNGGPRFDFSAKTMEKKGILESATKPFFLFFSFCNISSLCCKQRVKAGHHDLHEWTGGRRGRLKLQRRGRRRPLRREKKTRRNMAECLPVLHELRHNSTRFDYSLCIPNIPLIYPREPIFLLPTLCTFILLVTVAWFATTN